MPLEWRHGSNMTGRERLIAILAKRPKDGLSWTTLVDDVSLENFPPELQGHWGIDFYRHLGCDIFMLNGWKKPASNVATTARRWLPWIS